MFNQDLYFKKTVKYVGEPMSHLEAIASSAVCVHCFRSLILSVWVTFEKTSSQRLIFVFSLYRLGQLSR